MTEPFPARHLFRLVQTLPYMYEPARPTQDVACADAVTAFCGDINAVHKYDTLLGIVILRNAPYTLAALGARGDVDPYHVRFSVHDDDQAITAMHVLLYWHQRCTRAFLDAFPAFNVNVPCQSLPRGDGIVTPVHVLLKRGRTSVPVETTLQVLLDAGADCSRTLFEAFRSRFQADMPALLPHIVWLEGERRAWMIACVALAVGAADCCGMVSFVLECVLADTLRVCMAPQATGQPSHQLASEYAGMVAAFL